jgi:hypothetical protein
MMAAIGAAAGVAQAPAATQPPATRQLLTLREPMTIVQNAAGARFRVYNIRDASNNVSYCFGPDKEGNDAFVGIANTTPETWYSDVWTDVTDGPAAPVAPTPVQAAPVAPTPVQAAPVAPTPVQAPSATPAGIELYVDVIVKGFGVQDLDPWISAICAELAKTANLQDIRLADAQHSLGFGRWKAALGAAIKQFPPKPGAYYLADVRESEVRQVALEALSNVCTKFVRGR